MKLKLSGQGGWVDLGRVGEGDKHVQNEFYEILKELIQAL